MKSVHALRARSAFVTLLVLGAARASAQDASTPPKNETPPAQTQNPPVKPETPKADDHAQDSRARPTTLDKKFFRPDPTFKETFSYEEQKQTYDKAAVKTQRPLIELGREMYVDGPLSAGHDWFGEKNPATPHFMVYGDWRNALGYGKDEKGQDLTRLATRLNLDIDVQLTATERFHAFMRPLDRGGDFTRVDFGGNAKDDSDLELNGNLDAFFFEGDLGAMAMGATGSENKHDLPIALGKIPMLFQNGVWVEDAFVGGALTIPAMNSPGADISNFDITLFGGVDDVSSGAFLDAGDGEGHTRVVGATTFMETRKGYIEAGYGYTFSDGGGSSDQDYHNLTAAFTRRWFDWLSNSVRVIVNFGQDGPKKTADGELLLVENSFRTEAPYTLIPYLNLFAGSGTPQSLMRAADAGGVLKNTGINFDTTGLTPFPKLDATGHDAVGGAFGVEYLFDLVSRRQLVFEVAGVHPDGNDSTDPGNELGLGARYQMTLNNSWILRFDAVVATIEHADDLIGFAVEIRKKF